MERVCEINGVKLVACSSYFHSQILIFSIPDLSENSISQMSKFPSSQTPILQNPNLLKISLSGCERLNNVDATRCAVSEVGYSYIGVKVNN